MSAKAKPLIWTPPQPAAFNREKSKEPVDWLLDKHINAGGNGYLLGRRGTYKTATALHLAVAVITGKHPFGEDFSGISRTGPVVYMDALENNQLLYPRLQKVMNGMLLNPEEQEQVWDDLYTWHDTNLNFLNGRNVKELMAWAADLKPALIIFDTLQRFFVGGGYGDSETSMMIERDAQLRQATGAATLWLHHPPKNWTPGTDPFRGGSGFLDAADFAFAIQMKKGDTKLKVTCEKFRPGKWPEPFTLTVEETGDDEEDDAGVLTIRAGEGPSKEAVWQTQITAHVGAHPGATKTSILQAVKGKREEVSAVIDQMVQAAILTREQDGQAHHHFLAGLLGARP